MESIQKKLLRVRPPRVRITYDEETGGAMEKKELPFIVGILADLSGNRDTPDLTPALKDRKISDIDRDNFNDYIKKTAPRVSLNVARSGSPVLQEVLTRDGDNTIVFGSLDDFDPMNIIGALPSLTALYDSRSQMRTLQTRSEADDQFAGNLDTMIDGSNIQTANRAMAPVTPLTATQIATIRSSIAGLQTAIAAAPSATVPGDMLVTWGLLSAADQETANLTTPVSPAADIDAAKLKVIQATANAVILLGIFPAADVTKPSEQDIAALNLAVYLNDATKTDRLAITNVLPLLQNDPPRIFNALRHLAAQVVVGGSDTTVGSQLVCEHEKGAAAFIDVLVARIDSQLSAAVSAILHSEAFKQVESTWRGLHYLVENTETSTMLKLRILNVSKEELRKDMMKAVEFDQSALFKMVYEAEYGTYGGFPYSLLIGAYEIDGDQVDIDFLKKISEVAASAHAPFIAAASNKLFGLTSFEKLNNPRDLRKIFEGTELIGWRGFRETEDARYVSLVLPRALLRLPYGKPEKRNTIECEGFQFEEVVGELDAQPSYSEHGDAISYPTPGTENFLWGNAAFLLAERITNAFSLYSWTAAIRGVEGGGLVESLPVYTYTSDAGTTEPFCPTEVSIIDRREKELNDLGFISLCHCKGTGKAAFFGGQTTNFPKKYFSDEANANARISAMLPYMLVASRFAHYIKVIMREKIGRFLTRANVESYLNTWIANYVLLDDKASQEVKSSYPLRSASVVVTEVPGEPGSYQATVFIKPHFQLEELTTSIRLVANLPK